MGAQVVKRGPFALWVTLASACAHTQPLPERAVVHERAYLAERPVAVSGELQHVKDGVWCSDDDAFSLPVIPYPDGPVTVHDPYKGWGVTCSLDMYDTHGSVLQVVRTRIRPDLPQKDVMGRVEGNARAKGDGVPVISTEWVVQDGRRQLQQTNSSPVYDGKESAIYLLEGQSYSVGEQAESCRVDRHFVGNGYYFQIIAVAYRIETPKELCKVASEMASWAAQNIKVGQGCGKPAAASGSH